MEEKILGRLLAWEAIARNAYAALTPGQRAEVMARVSPLLDRQPAGTLAGTSEVKFEVTRIK